MHVHLESWDGKPSEEEVRHYGEENYLKKKLLKKKKICLRVMNSTCNKRTNVGMRFKV